MITGGTPMTKRKPPDGVQNWDALVGPQHGFFGPLEVGMWGTELMATYQAELHQQMGQNAACSRKKNIWGQQNSWEIQKWNREYREGRHPFRSSWRQLQYTYSSDEIHQRRTRLQIFQRETEKMFQIQGAGQQKKTRYTNADSSYESELVRKPPNSTCRTSGWVKFLRPNQWFWSYVFVTHSMARWSKPFKTYGNYHMGLSENRLNPYTQWFCWSLSL